jgi:MFS family permease
MPGVLLFVVMVTGIISSLGAPLIPSISEDLHVSLSSAQWSLTATLLIGVVASPVMGRLGDGPRRRETLLGGLAVVTAGSVIAALAPSLAVLVAGRAMQGGRSRPRAAGDGDRARRAAAGEGRPDDRPAWIIPAVDRRSGDLSPEELRREEEESELASAGLPGLNPD